jgi:hypothetical protein
MALVRCTAQQPARAQRRGPPPLLSTPAGSSAQVLVWSWGQINQPMRLMLDHQWSDLAEDDHLVLMRIRILTAESLPVTTIVGRDMGDDGGALLRWEKVGGIYSRVC